MDHAAGGFLDALFHDLAAVLGVGQARCQHFTQRRRGAQLLELLTVELLVLDLAPDLAEQVRRRNPADAQGPQAFSDDRSGGDGTQNDRQHHPATGFDQLPHGRKSPSEKWRHSSIGSGPRRPPPFSFFPPEHRLFSLDFRLGKSAKTQQQVALLRGVVDFRRQRTDA
ncbi:hypothetical protein D9M72_489500 [compost metagenome]